MPPRPVRRPHSCRATDAWLNVLQFADVGRGLAAPLELVVPAGSDVVHERRTETGDAFPILVTNAAVRDPVRPGLEQLAGEFLRHGVIARIVQRRPPAAAATDVVEVV